MLAASRVDEPKTELRIATASKVSRRQWRQPWCAPATGGGAAALRVEPLSKAQRLDPDGLPSLTQRGQADGAGRTDDSGPIPCPGIAGPDSFTLRVNEARLAN